MQHQLQHTLVVGGTEALCTSITKEIGNNLTKELSVSQSQQQHLLTVEHANAPSGDANPVTVTGSSSSHSSYLPPQSPWPVSPSLDLSSNISTGS